MPRRTNRRERTASSSDEDNSAEATDSAHDEYSPPEKQCKQNGRQQSARKKRHVAAESGTDEPSDLNDIDANEPSTSGARGGGRGKGTRQRRRLEKEIASEQREADDADRAGPSTPNNTSNRQDAHASLTSTPPSVSKRPPAGSRKRVDLSADEVKERVIRLVRFVVMKADVGVINEADINAEPVDLIKAPKEQRARIIGRANRRLSAVFGVELVAATQQQTAAENGVEHGGDGEPPLQMAKKYFVRNRLAPRKDDQLLVDMDDERLQKHGMLYTLLTYMFMKNPTDAEGGYPVSAKSLLDFVGMLTEGDKEHSLFVKDLKALLAPNHSCDFVRQGWIVFKKRAANSSEVSEHGADAVTIEYAWGPRAKAVVDTMSLLESFCQLYVKDDDDPATAPPQRDARQWVRQMRQAQRQTTA